MTHDEMIANLKKGLYEVIMRCYSEDATEKEIAMIPDLVTAFFNLF